MEFSIYELDVWGNSEDGYEVNDVIATDTIIDVDDIDNNNEIIDALRAEGYNIPKVTIDGDEFGLFIDREEDAKPLLELRRLY